MFTHRGVDTSLKLVLIAVASGGFLLSILAGSDRFHSKAQSANAQEKTVDQTQKNIQVLKGLPASQLFITMNFMRASLGVSCAYCHMNSGGDSWAWEKDDKPTKITARKHILMTQEINRSQFGGKTVVTCNTCHQGHAVPVALPQLPQIPPEGGPAGIIPTPVLPTVDEVLDKYVAALGGRAAIEKIRSREMKGSQISSSDGTSMPIEIYQQSDDKFVTLITAPRGVISQGFNGTSGWSKNPRGQRELTKAEIDDLMRASALDRPIRLKELYAALKITGKEKIGTSEVYVVESNGGTGRIQRFYFDVQNGLLVRYVVVNQNLLTGIPEQTDYEDYRDVGGVKVPFMIRQSYVDPWIGWTRKLTSIRNNVKIDEDKFTSPIVLK